MKAITEQNFNLVKTYRCGNALGVVIRVYTDDDIVTVSTLVGSWAELEDLAWKAGRQTRGKYERAFADRIAAAYARPSHPDLATEKQVAYIESLVRRVRAPWYTVEAHVVLRQPTTEAIESLTKSQASRCIDLLKMAV